MIVAGTVAAALASVLTVAAAASSAGTPAPIAEAPDQASAMRAASRQGSRVEVVDQRTSTRSVYANADGTMSAVIIDKNAWATVLSGRPNNAFWWTSGDHPWAQVGQCYQGSGGGCNGIGEAWAYFQFDTRFLAGKFVHDAALNTTLMSSPSCAERTHEIYHAAGAIWPGMTWNTRAFGGQIGLFTAPGANPNLGCGGPKGVSVSIPPNEVNRTTDATYFLKAADSFDQLAWRKYDPSATTLLIIYEDPR